MDLNTTVTAPASSPCTGICRMDADGWCLGCRRSMPEIVRWSQMSEGERRRIMTDILPMRPATQS
ncbi:MAG: DUF1289 domain-containing protein [Rhodanobacteraceae bacterium]